MIKLQGIVESDITDGSGRTVIVKWKTDKTILNHALHTPQEWEKVFIAGTDSPTVITDFKAEVKPIVEAMLSQLNNNLVGITIEEDIIEV